MQHLKFIFLIVILAFVFQLNANASTNYYYANSQKIYLEEIPDKKVYKLKSNKKKEIKVKEKIIKQVYPKSYFYTVNLSEDKERVVTKKLRTLVVEPIIELPFYREVDSGEELIITDDYFASFRKDLTNKELESIIENELNSEIVESLHYVLDGKGFHLKLREASDNVISVSNKCIENGWCKWSHPNFIRRVYRHAIPSDTYFQQQWHLKTINTEQAWDITKGDQNITIAVIDDGFDWDHEEFLSPGKIIKRFNLVENNNDPSLIGSGTTFDIIQNIETGKGFSHGTSVGGLAAASENGIGVVGVCPACMLLPIRIAIDDSIGTSLANFYLVGNNISAKAIAKAVDEGADVINCSWGGGSITSDIERSAIDYAQIQGRNSKGAVLVFSAGNESTKVVAPANYLPVLAVGATDRNDKITNYSNYGTEIDLVAPGGNGDIVTTDLIGIFGYSPINIGETLELFRLGLNQWDLVISDVFVQDTGTLNSWSLEFVDVNDNIFKFESFSMFLPIEDGLGITVSPGPPLVTSILPSLPIISLIDPTNGISLIKDIYVNLDITHPIGFDLAALLISPTEEIINLEERLPTHFPQSGSFIPINKHQIYHANQLPVFVLNDKNGNYTDYFSGTSASAPIVSGLIGLILSANPNLTYQQVDQILKDTADKVDTAFAGYDSTGHSNIYGFGRINAFNAVQKARDFSPVPIVLPTPTPIPTPQPTPPSTGCTSCSSSAQCNLGKYCDLNTSCCKENPSGCVTGCTNDSQCSSNSKCISNCCSSVTVSGGTSSGGGSVGVPSIKLHALPKSKRYVFKLLAEGINFSSSSSCNIDASVGGLKMGVSPTTFSLSLDNPKKIIQVIIPKNLRRFLYKQPANKIINVEVSCSNGATGLKTIPIE